MTTTHLPTVPCIPTGSPQGHSVEWGGILFEVQQQMLVVFPQDLFHLLTILFPPVATCLAATPRPCSL